MAIELTDALLTSITPPARGRLEFKDTRVPGLSFRVTATGCRTWTVLGRLPGHHLQIRPKIGDYPAVGLARARREAKQLLGDIARGIDPTAVKRAAARARAEAESAPTVAARLAEWQTAKARDWSARYRVELARVVGKMVLPKLGKRVLAEVKREDWVRLATTRRNKTPVTASWLYDVCSSFLNYAESAGWLGANPLPRRGRNHLVPRAQARDRVLSDAELVKVWQASAGLSPKSRAFARLLILTAARVSEVADIAAGEINLLVGRWTIPSERAKNEHALTVPLPPLAIAELRRVWPRGAAGAGFRLLGAVRGSGLRAPSKIKARLDELSGVTGWRWHDLRRSARTGMARLGVSDRAAEASLNHLSDRSALVRTYDRHDYAAEAAAALTAWQDHVTRLLEQSRSEGEVVA
jgi:integrase